MCQFSLEGYQTRKARKGETLYSCNNHPGAFTSDANDQRVKNDGSMVCIRYDQKLTLSNIEFRMPNLPKEIRRFIGKTEEVTLVKLGAVYHRKLGSKNGDSFKFADGTMIPTTLLMSAIVMPPRAKPVRKAHTKGMQRITEALGETKIDVGVTDVAVEYSK